MKNSIVWTCVVITCLATVGRAESIVDDSSPLETISTEFQLCDGPAWDGGSSLYVPDVKGGKLYRYRPGPKKLDVVLADAGRISGAFYNHGRLFLADNGESCISYLKGGKKVPIAGHDKDAKPPIRPNDLAVDNQGGIYYTLTGQGKVMYITADGKQLTAVEGIDTPNGLILSPDEQTLYVSSYVPKKIWAYEVLTPGSASAGREFSAMDDGPDKGADGMTIDRAGNVYCAGFKHVWIWSPGGKLLAKIETPTRPINCTFGDGDMHSLYITGFGGLYRQRMHVTGRPPQPPAKAEDQSPGNDRLSTALPDHVTAHWDVVYGAVRRPEAAGRSIRAQRQAGAIAGASDRPRRWVAQWRQSEVPRTGPDARLARLCDRRDRISVGRRSALSGGHPRLQRGHTIPQSQRRSV